MQVRDGFARIGAVVEHETIAPLLQTEFFGDLSSPQQELAQRDFVFRRRAGDVRNRLFGNDQNVRGRLRLDVAKGKHKFVLIDYRGWNFARDDLLKQGFAHNEIMRWLRPAPTGP